MVAHVHYIVARSRFGWSVSLEADRISDHADAKSALEQASFLSNEPQEDGGLASVVDLSSEDDG